MVHDLKQQEVELLIKNHQGLLLLEFGAPWCPPCVALQRTLEELAQTYSSRLMVIKVNVDENQELAAKFAVKSLPTVFLISNNEVLRTIYGKNRLEIYTAAIDESLSGGIYGT